MPSPGQKSFRISTIRTTRGRTEKSPGAIPPHRVGKPQSHWPDADCLGFLESGRARVAPRVSAAVLSLPERIRSHPQVRNPSISLQLQQPGDVNADHPGRYRPAGGGHPNPTGWLLIGWGSWSQRAARVVPRVNAEVPPHPGRIISYPRFKNLPNICNSNKPGT